VAVKLSQAGPIGFLVPVGLFPFIGHLPRPKVPCRLMEVPVGYRGEVVYFMVLLLFVIPFTRRKLMGLEEPLASLCHFKTLARISLSIIM